MKENRTLLDAEPGKTYRISQVDTNDEEMKDSFSDWDVTLENL